MAISSTITYIIRDVHFITAPSCGEVISQAPFLVVMVYNMVSLGVTGEDGEGRGGREGGTGGGKDGGEKREMLVKCASTSLNSKLVCGEKDFFAVMVVDAVSTLDQRTLDLSMLGVKKVVGGKVGKRRFFCGVFLSFFEVDSEGHRERERDEKKKKLTFFSFALFFFNSNLPQAASATPSSSTASPSARPSPTRDSRCSPRDTKTPKCSPSTSSSSSRPRRTTPRSGSTTPATTRP